MKTMMTRALITTAALLLALSAGAADVAFTPAVRNHTTESLGIPTAGVRPLAARAFREERQGTNDRAAAVFERNPVAAKVRTAKAAQSENDRSVKFRRGSVDFEVSKAAGAEILLDLDRYAKREAARAGVDAKSVERGAREYVRAHMPDVNPGELHFAGVKTINDSVAQFSEDGKLGEVRSNVANYIVIFERKMNNVRFVGPGEKIRVYFSAGGEVVGHSKIWRQLDPGDRAARPVVPPGRVRDAVGARLARHPAPRVEVDFFDFGYFAQGRYTRQETLNPVYLVGYKAGPESKRVIQIFDAYTGEEIAPPPDPQGADVKPK